MKHWKPLTYHEPVHLVLTQYRGVMPLYSQHFGVRIWGHVGGILVSLRTTVLVYLSSYQLNDHVLPCLLSESIAVWLVKACMDTFLSSFMSILSCSQLFWNLCIFIKPLILAYRYVLSSVLKMSWTACAELSGNSMKPQALGCHSQMSCTICIWLNYCYVIEIVELSSIRVGYQDAYLCYCSMTFFVCFR